MAAALPRWRSHDQVESISRYQFGVDPRRGRALMRFYAGMFRSGPVADLGVGRGFFLEALRDRGTAGVGVEAVGHGPVGLGPKNIPAVTLGRIRHGLEYGRPEIWVRAVRP